MDDQICELSLQLVLEVEARDVLSPPKDGKLGWFQGRSTDGDAPEDTGGIIKSICKKK